MICTFTFEPILQKEIWIFAVIKIQFMTILLAVEYLTASFINAVFYLKKTEMAE